jgi:hypothetical protein
VREHHAGTQRALDGGSGEIGPGSAGGEGGDVQTIAGGAIPICGIGGVFERNAAAGEILREASPGGEIELIGPLELRQAGFCAFVANW